MPILIDEQVISFPGKALHLNTADVISSKMDYPLAGDLLSSYVRYYEKEVCIFERPPELKVVFFNGTAYEIELPWVVGVINFRPAIPVLEMGFRTRSISSLEDMIYFLPVPNISTGFGVCLGNGNLDAFHNDIEVPGTSIQDKITHFLNYFWDGDGNNDYRVTRGTLPKNLPNRKMRREEISWPRWLGYWERYVNRENVLGWTSDITIRLAYLVKREHMWEARNTEPESFEEDLYLYLQKMSQIGTKRRAGH